MMIIMITIIIIIMIIMKMLRMIITIIIIIIIIIIIVIIMIIIILIITIIIMISLGHCYLIMMKYYTIIIITIITSSLSPISLNLRRSNAIIYIPPPPPLPDDDECEALYPCSYNADCTNLPGTFECTCKEGYRAISQTECEGRYSEMLARMFFISSIPALTAAYRAALGVLISFIPRIVRKETCCLTSKQQVLSSDQGSCPFRCESAQSP